MQTSLFSLDDIASSIHTAVTNILQEYADVFPDEIPPGLPPVRGIEHQILILGATLPNRQPTEPTPIRLRKFSDKFKNFWTVVRERLSPLCCSYAFSSKDGTWHMCVDCRAINNITVRYRHPIPRLDDMLDELSDSIIFF